MLKSTSIRLLLIPASGHLCNLLNHRRYAAFATPPPFENLCRFLIKDLDGISEIRTKLVSICYDTLLPSDQLLSKRQRSLNHLRKIQGIFEPPKDTNEISFLDRAESFGLYSQIIDFLFPRKKVKARYRSRETEFALLLTYASFERQVCAPPNEIDRVERHGQFRLHHSQHFHFSSEGHALRRFCLLPDGRVSNQCSNHRNDGSYNGASKSRPSFVNATKLSKIHYADGDCWQHECRQTYYKKNSEGHPERESILFHLVKLPRLRTFVERIAA